MNIDELVRKNFEYFKNELLPYYIILYLKNEQIIIDIQKYNLKHLLGIHNSRNLIYKEMHANQLYNILETTNDPLNIISQELLDNDEMLDVEDQFILDKNYFFIDLFDSMFHKHNIRFFISSTSDFDTGYVHFFMISEGGGYIGIIGGDKSDYHYFNSIQYIRNDPKKYIGVQLVVYKVERILKSDFDSNNYKFKKSIRNINNQTNKKTNNKKKIGFNYKAYKNLINKQLKPGLVMKMGAFKKHSVQIYKDNICMEKHFEDIKSFQSVNEIVDYINSTYE